MKKRTLRDGYRSEYRPDSDKSHAGELQRMIKADKMLRSLPRHNGSDLGTFRLSGRPFYVKLCEATIKAPLDAGMTPGMYIPLGLWSQFLNSAEVCGSRGARVVTWDNCLRRFNNSEFTNLLRDGWIGSAAGQSAALHDIIEDVLASNRMLVLAATSADRESREMRRDDLGRFTAENDPAGAI
jgi:hypothetical protein